MKKMNKIVGPTIIIAILLSAFIAFSADNPFVSKKSGKKVAPFIHYPVFVQKIMNKIAPMQHEFRNKLNILIHQLKNRRSKKTLLLILLISFIYGVIHALAPGHGKILTVSYFLSRQAHITKGILAGNIIAFLHAGSAIIVVLTLYFIVKQSYLISFEGIQRIITLVSYGLIAVLGLFLSLKALHNLKRRNSQDDNSFLYNNAGNKNLLLVAFAIGMVPCPAAVIILLFSIALDILNIGIILTLFMALGMAFTISSVGVATIFAKQSILKFFSSRDKTRNTVQKYTEFSGSLLILFLGVFLFIISF